jgi:hypothetical protein
MDANPEISEEAFTLIDRTYRPIKGHLKIQRPRDIRKYDYTHLVDMERTPAPDIVTLGKYTPHGIKLAAMGTTGTPGAKHAYLAQHVAMLEQPGMYGEVSDALAHVLITRYPVRIVSDEKTVRDVLQKPLQWFGKHPEGKYPRTAGWYARRIGGKEKLKILVGRPRKKKKR